MESTGSDIISLQGNEKQSFSLLYLLGRLTRSGGLRAKPSLTAFQSTTSVSSSPLLKSVSTTPVTTIEKDEEEKFRGFATHWWDTDGDLRGLHSMNRLRVAFIRDGLSPSVHAGADSLSHAQSVYKPLAGLRILDVGCGGGILTEPLAQLGANVLGIDQVQDSLDAATRHAQLMPHRWSSVASQPPEYRFATLESLAFDLPGQFDAVVMSEVLEHVSNWESMITQASTCLKANGMLFVTTLNQTQLSYLLGIVAAEQLLRVVPKGTHEWNKFIPPDRMQATMLNFVGFRTVPYEDRLLHLNLFPLEYRRRRGDLIFTRRILLGELGEELLDIFDPSDSEKTRGHTVKLFKPRRSRLSVNFTLSTRVINDWDALPREVVETESERAFKLLIDELIFTRPGLS